MPNEAIRFIRFTCPCGGSLTVKPEEAKKLVSCPFCSRPLRASDFKIKSSSSQVLDQSQSSIEASNSSRSGIMANSAGEGFPDKPDRVDAHRVEGQRLAAEANRQSNQNPSSQTTKSQTQQRIAARHSRTMQRSMTETDVGASGVTSPSDSVSGSSEWAPNTIVKPAIGKKSARPFKKRSELDKGDRDLYMTVGLCTFGALFLGGVLFWVMIQSNRGANDVSIDVGDEVSAVETGAGLTNSKNGAAGDGTNMNGEGEKPSFNKPCIRLVSGEWQISQALGTKESEVEGARLFVDVTVENLTECDIVLIRFELKCQDKRFLGKRHVVDYQFKKPLKPGEIANIDFTAESGDWDSINAYAIRFESSDGQVNSDRVGPYLLDN